MGSIPVISGSLRSPLIGPELSVPTIDRLQESTFIFW